MTLLVKLIEIQPGQRETPNRMRTRGLFLKVLGNLAVATVIDERTLGSLAFVWDT